MSLRKSDIFLLYMVLNFILGAALFSHALSSAKDMTTLLRAERNLVSRLGLTDICLFTEARYTRNPSMADLHSSFQDNPISFDHFPSGAIVPVPPHLKRHALH